MKKVVFTISLVWALFGFQELYASVYCEAVCLGDNSYHSPRVVSADSRTEAMARSLLDGRCESWPYRQWLTDTSCARSRSEINQRAYECVGIWCAFRKPE